MEDGSFEKFKIITSGGNEACGTSKSQINS